MENRTLLVLGAIALVILAYLALFSGNARQAEGGANSSSASGTGAPSSGSIGRQQGGINITEKDLPKIEVPRIDMPKISINISLPSMPNASSLAGMIGQKKEYENVSVSDVKMTAIDGVEVRGSAYLPTKEKPSGSIVLVHMLGQDRHSYDDFAPLLAQKGFAVLSIDMRGHGQTQYKDGYGSFSASDFLSAKKDIDAAIGYLYDSAGEGAQEKTYIIGASIGANLALQYAADGQRKIDGVALLSPGLDYRGVKTEEAASAYNGRTLILSSSEDTYAASSSLDLKKINPNYEIETYTGLGHGTDMLSNEEVKGRIIGWLSR